MIRNKREKKEDRSRKRQQPDQLIEPPVARRSCNQLKGLHQDAKQRPPQIAVKAQSTHQSISIIPEAAIPPHKLKSGGTEVANYLSWLKYRSILLESHGIILTAPTGLFHSDPINSTVLASSTPPKYFRITSTNSAFCSVACANSVVDDRSFISSGEPKI